MTVGMPLIEGRSRDPATEALCKRMTHMEHRTVNLALNLSGSTPDPAECNPGGSYICWHPTRGCGKGGTMTCFGTSMKAIELAMTVSVPEDGLGSLQAELLELVKKHSATSDKKW